MLHRKTSSAKFLRNLRQVRELEITDLNEDESALPRKSKLPALMMQFSSILPISKKFISVLYFKVYGKVICEIVDCFQKPDCLIYKNIKDVFLRLCSWNYDYRSV